MSSSRRASWLLAATIALAAALAQGTAPALAGGGAAPTGRGAGSELPYLSLATQGVSAARAWRRGGWYEERLGDRDRYPLATIWGIVPLFETLDAIAVASPSSAHRAAVATFARGAESYFNRSLRPTPGYAPYPNDRGQPRTWFDDNGWWGIAFMDAYRATHDRRYVADAARAFAFIAAQGWDAKRGGMWWNTSHPYKSGPALASDTLLGALLYAQTHSSFYLTQIEKFLAWADRSFLTEDALYAQSNNDGTPTPYVEGPMVEAHQILCEAGQQSDCGRARQLADGCWQRFEERLTMGPQFDTIYLHWMLVYGRQTGDARWAALAKRTAARAYANALTGQRRYLGAWDGTSITEHQARPGMLQTHAATTALFGWLAADG